MSKDFYQIDKEIVDWAILIGSSFIPQIAIAYLAKEFIGNGTWAVFWWSIAAMNGFYFIMWLFNTTVTSIMFKFYFKQRLSDRTYKDLVACDFPDPARLQEDMDYNIECDAEDYYYEVWKAENFPCNLRVEAMAQYMSIVKIKGFFALKRMRKAHRDALDRYKALKKEQN
jgi:hypothetical protein